MDNIIFIKDIINIDPGGKAAGLKHLIECGLRVPDGFVIIDPGSVTESSLKKAIDRLGDSPKAVRSSAALEDGLDYSFAGQFESCLNISGIDNIIKAIKKTLASEHCARAVAYSDSRGLNAKNRMRVIVQNMVDAKFSGVLFTANPADARRDRMVVDFIEGLGEGLVSGRKTGTHLVLTRRGRPVGAESSKPIILEPFMSGLVKDALSAENFFGHPLDMEWAIDCSGNLYWLQARPITAISPVHLNELDSKLENPGDILTRCNIGEMMPGAVTPLTWSVFGRAIDIGMQYFYKAAGVLDKSVDRPYFVRMFYNHLFLDISRLYDVIRRVLFTKREDIELALLGRILEGERIMPDRRVIVRFFNLIRYAIYLSGANRALDDLREMEKTFVIYQGPDILKKFHELTAGRDLLCAAYEKHYIASGQSGALHGILSSILRKKTGRCELDLQSDLASLLANIDGIESAEPVKAIEKIADTIYGNKDVMDYFLSLEPGACLEWIKGPGSGTFGNIFNEFLSTHGHRCVREAELREKDWSERPESLIHILQTRLKMLSSDGQKKTGKNNEGLSEQINKISAGLSYLHKFIIKTLLVRLRMAVAKREKSKSHCIKIQRTLKQAYIGLGLDLSEQGLLIDEDCIFFLTHPEIGELISGNESLKKTSASRRNLHPEFSKLEFSDIFFGEPEPIEQENEKKVSENYIIGLPVSRGSAKGKARIVRSLDEAADLQPGDIMIAPYTDIGWSPFFSIIGGLVTEIGSPLSHGAVIAREFGIPAVVGARGALRAFRNGDEIIIDGKKGTVSRAGLFN
jgi:pyruvate,water dikinase